MDTESLCCYIKETLTKLNVTYDVTWNYETSEMIWKNERTNIVFSKKDSELLKTERYLLYIIDHLPCIETTVSEITSIVRTLEKQQQERIPVVFSYRFPKMISYVSSKKMIVVNPIKLGTYVARVPKNRLFALEEIFTFIFLHEFGHYLEEQALSTTDQIKRILSYARMESQEEVFLLEKLRLSLYEMEKKAWQKGKSFLFLFPYNEQAYDAFALFPLSSYERAPHAYLKEKLYYAFAP